MEGLVFNIERFAVYDGPGIRTVVFLKGCNLRCSWCSNPESQDMRPELMHSNEKCLGAVICGMCARACPHGAITETGGALSFHKENCRRCGKCTQACPSGAMEMSGRKMTADEVVQEILLDAPFFRHSSGGVTFSGGEPLLQAEFVREICLECADCGINTAIETTGNVPWEAIEKTAPYIHTFMWDVKHMDSGTHRQHTSVGNERILDNLQRLNACFPESHVIVRTPVIPGFNDTEKDIQAIAQYIAKLLVVREYALLPFHVFGLSKYEALGRRYEVDTEARIPEELMERLREIAQLEQYR